MTTSLTYETWAFCLVLGTLGLLIVITLIGNTLVLAALLCYPRLRSAPNLLIGNLAISDFLLALTVLPVSMVTDATGHWLFGARLCDAWLSIDVLCCTASVWGLVAIAFDRFTATNFPVWYRGRQSQRHVVYYVLLVWTLSALICLPGMAGWGSQAISEQYAGSSTTNNTVTVNGEMFNSTKTHVFNSKTKRYDCVLFTQPYYVVYSAMGSFIVPLIIMIVLYTKIFILLNSRQKNRRSKKSSEVHGTLYSSRGDESRYHTSTDRCMQCLSCGFKKYSLPSLCSETPVASIDAHSSWFTDIGSAYSSNQPRPTIETHVNQGINNVSTQSGDDRQKCLLIPGHNENPDGDSVQFIQQSDIKLPLTSTDGGPAHLDDASVSSQTSYLATVNRPIASRISCPSLRQPLPWYDRVTRISRSGGYSSTSASHILKICDRKSMYTARSREPSVRSFERREQRATWRMAVLICVFIFCWIPFTMMYLIRGVCGIETCPDQPHIRVLVTWLGYANSAINPLLCAYLNKQIKHAFVTLLKCRTAARDGKRRRQQEHKSSWPSSD